MRMGFVAAVAGAGLFCGLCGLPVRGADPEIAWREKVRATVNTNGVAVATDTNVVTVASRTEPAYVGQLLFGGAGEGTNAVWVAKGLTTNDWVRLAP